MIHILILDDHPAIGAGTKAFLEEQTDFDVTVMTTGKEALEHMKNHYFDVVITDLNMPDINGIEITKEVVSKYPNTKVIIYTGYEINHYFDLLNEAGFHGAVSKSSSVNQLITSIRCSLEGEVVLPLEVVRELTKQKSIVQSDDDKTIELNPREQQILIELSKGLSNQEIADLTFLSKRAIENYLTAIYRKLNVKNRREAIDLSIEKGLIPSKLKM